MPYVVDSHGITGTGMIVGIISGVGWATADLMWRQHLVVQVFRWIFFLLTLAIFSIPLWVGVSFAKPLQIGCLASLSRVGVGDIGPPLARGAT